MQTLDCAVGAWQARAAVQQICPDKVMAVIHVLDREDAEAVASSHTIVFDHEVGNDAMAATQQLVHGLLSRRYGAW